jgi:predicted acylesterase/phospholipase RssA
MTPTQTENYKKAEARLKAMSAEQMSALAKDIINGTEEDAEFCVALGLKLKGRRAFDLARRVLEHADPSHPKSTHAYRDTPRDEQPALKILARQQLALCTYKDEDEPANRRFDAALAVLDQIDFFGDTEDEKQETLGLYGAIYKRKWELDAQRENLERSLRYYREGAARGVGHKQGYTAINAAYVLELMAYQEDTARLYDQRLTTGAGAAAGALGSAAAAMALRAEADGLRQAIALEITKQLIAARIARKATAAKDAPVESDWWVILTIAEAYFGLRDYKVARDWLMEAADLHDRLKLEEGRDGRGIDAWMWESPLRQFSSLARLHAGPTLDEDVLGGAGEVLGAFMKRGFGTEGDTRAIVRSALMGKIGLGLSGGGFRASLFHIGVLAKMAELDLLRRVEVLSCVSGGSIIGAHYYLEVRHLLQTKRDEEVTREDYVDIVRRVERDFLAGVQRNIRTRVIAEWWTNIKLVFSRTYTRTNRAGELYERELYARVGDGGAQDDKGREAPRWLNDLRVTPEGEAPGFHPRYDNWRRAAKIPVLVVNATTLNTGHNWQYTATWMGEPPMRIATEVDASDWLRRMYYRQAKPAGHDRVRLGDAVAASSCVPGLFEPLVIEKLFPDRTLRLVDGGAHDNQGISALLDQDCNVILISDASGQMSSVKDVEAGLAGAVVGGALGSVLSVLLRTQDVLMARVREAQHLDLDGRHRLGQLRGLMYIHLTKDLHSEAVPWLYCDDPLPGPDNDALTVYGVRKEVQRLLAGVRTDLDSFTDAEAYALMTSGYRMAGHDPELRRLAGIQRGAGGDGGRELNWRFLVVESRMNDVSADPRSPYQTLLKQLQVAANVPFKVWRLLRWLQVVAGGLALFVLAAAVLGVWYALTTPAVRDTPVATYGSIIMAALQMIAAALVSLVIGKTLMKVVDYKKTLRRALVHLGLSMFGFLLARLHICLFDRLYLRLGSVRVKPHVFLCYARSDEGHADALDAALRGSGCATALDGKETLFNEASAAETEQLIADADTVLFIEGADSNDSAVCRRWLAFAGSKGKEVVKLPARGGPFNFKPKPGAVAPDGGRRLDGKALRSLLDDIGAGGGPPAGGNGGGAPVAAARTEEAARVSREETGANRAG